MVSGAASACSRAARFGGLADDGPLLCRAGADDFADDNEPGCDTDPRLKACPVRALDTANLRQDADRSANGAFCRILEGPRKAKIGEHAVAHEFRNEAAEPSNRAGCGILIAPDQTAEKFGIDHARQCRRADHVAEQHRNLTPLRIGRSLCVGRLWRRGFGTALGDRL